MNLTHGAWRLLHEELSLWAAAGKVATLWWRDDDAIAPTAALDRMLGLVVGHRIPLGLAVIPARATAALADRLADEPLVGVLQHGFAHINNATAGERAAEFGTQRPLAVKVAEIADGWRTLSRFPRVNPIFVPPWNRYDSSIAHGAAACGLRAISAFGPARQLSGAIVECNCHVDIISWRTTRGFAGVEKTVRKLSHELYDRRSGASPAQGAIGLLTHHLDHDEECWRFLGDLFQLTDRHPAIRWVSPLEALTDAEKP